MERNDTRCPENRRSEDGIQRLGQGFDAGVFKIPDMAGEDCIHRENERSGPVGARGNAESQKRGWPRQSRDTVIAGIVRANRATSATRNWKHFEDIAGSVVNPWGDDRDLGTEKDGLGWIYSLPRKSS